MNRHFFYLLLLLLVLPFSVVAQSTVVNVRSARFQLSDRIVVETSGVPNFKVASTGNLGTVMVDFFDVKSAPALGELSSSLQMINGWTSEYFPEEKIFRLNLKHSVDIAWSSFVLKQPNRLVIDFSRADSASASNSPSPVKSSEKIVGSLNFGNDATPTTYNEPQPQAVQEITVQPSRVNGFRPRTIIIDAGHGGHHRGGVGKVNGRKVEEAQLTPPIAEELRKLLKKDPRFHPEMTRTSDTYIGLRERTHIAEQKNGNLFVSIHYNSVPPGRSQNTARGLEFWVWGATSSARTVEDYLFSLDNEEDSNTDVGNPKGQAKDVLSQMVGDSLDEQTVQSRLVAKGFEKSFMTDSYFKNNYRGIKDARFKVLENYTMPSVLVEVGFISHPEESKMATQPEFQKKVARLIYQGIINYYEANDSEFRMQVAGR